MENFNRFLIKLQKFDVIVLEEEIAEGQGRAASMGSSLVPKKKKRYYSLKHEVPELNQCYGFEIRELMEMALTDLLNLDVSKLTHHMLRMDSLEKAFSEIELNYNKPSFAGGDGEAKRREYLFSLGVADRFNVGLLNLRDESTTVTNEFLWDFYDTIQYRREVLVEFQRRVEDILSLAGEKKKDAPRSEDYPEGRDKAGSVMPSETVSGEAFKSDYGIPVIQRQYVETVFTALEGYFWETKKELRTLFELGSLKSGKCVFNGKCNQLCDLFKQMMGKHLVEGCSREEFIHWICRYFEYRQGKIVKNIAPDYVKKIFEGATVKNPLYTIEYSEDEKKYCFIPCS